MKRGILVVALLGYSVMALLGCASTATKGEGIETPALLESQAMLKFPDIPIPAGLKLVAEDSYSFESPGVRVGILRYRGKVNSQQVVNFYKEQMPMYNWNLLNIVEYGECLLNFERDTETCIVKLTPRGKLVTMVITIGPKSQVYKKSGKKTK